MKTKSVNKNNLSPLRPYLKWIVVAFSLLISIGSIWYTNLLVEQLKKQEQRQITLYAESLKYLGQEESNSSGFIYLIFDKIVDANQTIPVILADQNGNPEYYKNISKADKIASKAEKKRYLIDQTVEMAEKRPPIEILLTDPKGTVYGKKFIYYKNSKLLNQLGYYPYIQLSIIAIFGLITFLTFNYLRKSEQNRVWVGLAKETAHQLGTPLSSLMAWSEYLKATYPNEASNLRELDKDIDRFKVITDRFSSIGSNPNLELVNLPETIDNTVVYLRKRISTKVNFVMHTHPDSHISAKVNPSLFAWVVENICKNAVDAMSGIGEITINILYINQGKIAVDISDTGKGIAKSNISNVFRPGFTTKRRGWGLGLALAKRIIEEYHKGKIFVKSSEVGKGTTFRILLNR